MTSLPRLLIVEDELVVAENVRDSLAELGYPIIGIATSQPEVLRAIDDDPPDLVLMDIRLKGRADGIKLADRIRAQTGLPIIFMTAHADPTLLERARFTQAYGIVLKPFTTRELHSTIQMAYSKWQTDQRLEHALNVSVQRQAEVYALLKGARAVLTYQEFDQAARAIFDAACELIGAVSGYVAMLNDDGSENELLFLEAGGLPCEVDPALPMPVRGLRAEAYHTGQAVYDNQFATSQWWDFLPDGHVELRNVLFAPLNLDGKTVGIIGLANKPGDFTDHDAQMATAFGELASIALRNSRTLADLRESEHTARALIEAPTDSMFLLAPDSTILDLNETAARKLGQTRQDLLNRRALDLFPARVAAHRQQRIQDVLSTGQPVHFEDEREGMWFDTIVYPVPDPDGTITRLATVARDVTERKQFELRMSHLAHDLNEHVKELNCLYGLSRLMENAGQSIPNVMNGAVKLAQDAWQHSASTAVRITLNRPPLAAQTANFRPTPWTQTADIHVSGHVAGQIEVCYLDEQPPADEGPFLNEERGLLNTIAERLGQFVERVEVNTALEQRVVQLMLINQVAEQVAQQLDLDTLLAHAATLIQERFDYQHVGLFMLDPAHKALVLRAKAGRDAARLSDDHQIKLGQGLVGRAAQQGTTLFADDVTTDPRYYNPFHLEQTIGSEISVPIKLGGDVVGVLDIQSNQTDTLDATDGMVLETLAKQLAAAIQNARLYGQLQQHAGRLEQEVAARTQELSAAYENLKELSSAKDEFLTRVSHELRTPLTTITLRHHLLATHHPDLRAKYLDTLERETRRLHYIVEELLYVSDMQQTQLELHPEPVDLNELVRLYALDRQPVADERQLTLRVDGAADLPPLHLDRRLIERVLGILLENAFNYTPAQGTVAITTLRQQTDGATWAGFAVQDTGYGIHPDEHACVFQRFYRGKLVRERLTTVPGAGLGLSIAREIVQQHQGEITIASDGVPGSGTRVTVWLPAG